MQMVVRERQRLELTLPRPQIGEFTDITRLGVHRLSDPRVISFDRPRSGQISYVRGHHLTTVPPYDRFFRYRKVKSLFFLLNLRILVR